MTDNEPGDRIPVSADIRKLYSDRCEHNRNHHQALKIQSRWLSFLRLTISVGIIVMLFIGLWNLSGVKVWALGVCGLGLVVFLLVARIHDRVDRAAKRHKDLLEINEVARFRLERNWDELPASPVPPELSDHPVAKDLDLFHREEKRASLFRLLATPGTPGGREKLYEWLMKPADPKIVRARQAAVRELSPKLDWRQELELAGRDMLEKPSNPTAFLEWAEGEPWLSGKGWLVWTARVVPLINFSLIGLNVAGILPSLPWIALTVASLFFTMAWGGEMRRILGRVDWSSRAFGVYARLFRMVTETSFDSKILCSLKESMEAKGLSAHRQMQRLDRIKSYAEARYYMIHFLLQAFLFWDFHVLTSLERWQREAGRSARKWLSVLGEIEALSVISGLQHDHPDWAVPEVLDDADSRLEAEGIGHPLLHPDECIANDVTVGPRGTFQLITGSNMSGKSTLLRALGVNAVLAQAGGPVCARAFCMSSLALGTSFRIQDVLEDGVSYFMAELLRLKDIVNLAQISREGGRPVLYLLDEILLGTNIFERQVAVRKVIGHLIEQGAIGSIATHDLSLADAEGLSDACRPFHFTETYEKNADGSRMVFEYKLRPGVAQTTNALKLLEFVGIRS
jgi:hypothetical protein